MAKLGAVAALVAAAAYLVQANIFASSLFGLAGVIMATPAFIQWYYSKPDIRLIFDKEHDNVSKMLCVFVHNMPVQSRMLEVFQVERKSVQSLTAQFRIEEAASGNIVLKNHQALFYTDSKDTQA